MIMRIARSRGPHRQRRSSGTSSPRHRLVPEVAHPAWPATTFRFGNRGTAAPSAEGDCRSAFRRGRIVMPRFSQSSANGCISGVLQRILQPRVQLQDARTML